MESQKKIFRAYALARAKLLPTLANMTRILDSMGLMYKKSSCQNKLFLSYRISSYRF
ncbi:hypothetical protein [Helicobacter bilis]|uniref:hypothetical protein n=1 Tax=Helicobacter bilis TaxID=37372 RepID=UPI00248E22EC|nr:hypothetical protein [Helicobacter bilis]